MDDINTEMRLSKVFQHQKLFEGAADYQAMINAFPYDQVAKINPFGMFPSPNIDEFVETIKELFQNQLYWAKRTLKRQDRIIWWLKKTRIDLYYTHVYTPLHYHNNRDFSKKSSLPDEYQKIELKYPRFFDPDSKMTYEHVGHDSIEHYMAIDYHKIQNHVWSNESPSELLNQFREWEKEYTELKHRYLKPDSSHTVILDYGEYVWLNLNKASCRDEAAAGRHCGNSPRSTSNDRVLSFRQKVKKDQQVILTFVLEEGGLLGERKGYANTKPKPEYHPYIVDLLKQPFIKGMKEGRWLRGHDFELTDLEPDLAKSLFNDKTELFRVSDVLGVFGENSPEIKELFEKAPTNFTIPELMHIFGKGSPELVKHFEDYSSRFQLREVIDCFGYESDQFMKKCVDDEVYKSGNVAAIVYSKTHRKILLAMAVDAGNTSVFMHDLNTVFGKDSEITLQMRNLKLADLDLNYLNEIAQTDVGQNVSLDSAEGKAALTAVVEEAVEKGYDLKHLKLTTLTRILPQYHYILEEWVEENASTMSESDAGFIIHKYDKSEKHDFFMKLLEAGNVEISDSTIGHSLGGLPNDILVFMIKNSLNVRFIDLHNTIRRLGVEHPQVKELALKVATKEIMNYGPQFFNDPAIFSVLNEDEAYKIVTTNKSLSTSMYKAMIDKYGPKSIVVSHIVDTGFIPYTILEEIAPALGVDDFQQRVTDAVQLLIEHQGHQYFDINSEHLVFEGLKLEGAAKTIFTNIKYLLDLYDGVQNYESFTQFKMSDFEEYFHTLTYREYNSETKDYEAPVKYDMKPVYVRYIKEKLMEEWDEEHEELPEDEDIETLATFLQDRDENWAEAFEYGVRSGEENGYTSEIMSTFIDEVMNWSEKNGSVYYTFARKEGDRYIETLDKKTIHDETFFIVARVPSLLKETKVLFNALIAAEDPQRDPDDTFDDLDFDAVEYIHIDEDFFDPDSIISQTEFSYPDYAEIDEEYLSSAFYEYMPVDINYVIDCQKK